MIARSLDVVVLLKLLLGGDKTYAQLSQDIGISASEIHAAVRRCVVAGLIHPESKRPLRRPVEDYLLFGVRYAFPAKPGPIAAGVPTAYAAPLIAEQVESDDLPPVWPDAEGLARGYSIEPLHISVPRAAKADPKLYELLALVDALRIGRARERKLAEGELRKRLEHAQAD